MGEEEHRIFVRGAGSRDAWDDELHPKSSELQVPWLTRDTNVCIHGKPGPLPTDSVGNDMPACRIWA